MAAKVSQPAAVATALIVASGTLQHWQDGFVIGEPLRVRRMRRSRVTSPIFSSIQPITSLRRSASASIPRCGHRLYRQNQEPGKNLSNQIWRSIGTEQAKRAASYTLRIGGIPHGSAFSFLSLLARIGTPGPGHSRVRRFTFNDQQPRFQRRIREWWRNRERRDRERRNRERRNGE